MMAEPTPETDPGSESCVEFEPLSYRSGQATLRNSRSKFTSQQLKTVTLSHSHSRYYKASLVICQMQYSLLSQGFKTQAGIKKKKIFFLTPICTQGTYALEFTK